MFVGNPFVIEIVNSFSLVFFLLLSLGLKRQFKNSLFTCVLTCVSVIYFIFQQEKKRNNIKWERHKKRWIKSYSMAKCWKKEKKTKMSNAIQLVLTFFVLSSFRLAPISCGLSLIHTYGAFSPVLMSRNLNFIVLFRFFPIHFTFFFYRKHRICFGLLFRSQQIYMCKS